MSDQQIWSVTIQATVLAGDATEAAHAAAENMLVLVPLPSILDYDWDAKPLPLSALTPSTEGE